MRALPFLALLVSTVSLADSPLTSTDINTAYADISQIAEAHGTDVGTLTFLCSDAPTDQKAAAINKMGWNTGGQNKAQRFVAALAGARGKTIDRLEIADFTAADKMVLAYLLALDDYFDLSPLKKGGRGFWGMQPTDLLTQAMKMAPNDFTIAYVRGLVVAQVRMDGDWCGVYRETETVLERFPESERNMRAAAVESAQSYIDIYRSYCKDKPVKRAATPKVVTTPQMNMIYEVERFKNWMITGTQGGIVAWDTATSKPVAAKEGFICNSVVVWGDAVWAGCDKRVWRWDGTSWSKFLENTDNDAQYYDLILGSSGELIARYGGQAWDFSEGQFAWRDGSVGGYDAIHHRGELWRIDFLSGINGPNGNIDLRGEVYPGSDPRRFRVDSVGRLWVEDFRGGLFRYNDDLQVFKHIGLTEKGMGVAVDRVGEVTWMLHYGNGLSRFYGDQLSLNVDLSDMQNMRDLHLDDDGTVWVGGWTGLARIVVDGDRVSRKNFVAK